MINKEDFIKRMGLISNFCSEQETVQALIDKISDGHSVVTVGDYIVCEMINMIEEDLGYKDILDWWLYEDVDKVIYIGEHGEIEISVRTLDELYDFMVKYGKMLTVH